MDLSLVSAAEGFLTPGLSAGAIAGIVIGVLLVVGVAVGVAVYFMKKKGWDIFFFILRWDILKVDYFI